MSLIIIEVFLLIFVIVLNLITLRLDSNKLVRRIYGDQSNDYTIPFVSLEELLFYAFIILSTITIVFLSFNLNHFYFNFLILNIICSIICFYIIVFNPNPSRIKHIRKAMEAMAPKGFGEISKRNSQKLDNNQFLEIWGIESYRQQKLMILNFISITDFNKIATVRFININIESTKRIINQLKIFRKNSLNDLNRRYRSNLIFIVFFIFISFSFLFYFGSKIHYFEFSKNYTKSIIDSFYFTSVTITTAGYGDVYPTNNESKFAVMILLLINLSIISIIVNLISGHVKRKIDKLFFLSFYFQKKKKKDLTKLIDIIEHDEFRIERDFVLDFFKDIKDQNIELYDKLIELCQKA